MVEAMDREIVRHYAPGHTTPFSQQAQRFGKPRPGHGQVYISADRHGKWSATWLDDYPTPDPQGATSGTSEVEGEYDDVIAWARPQPAQAVHIARPVVPVPRCPPDQPTRHQPPPPPPSPPHPR